MNQIKFLNLLGPSGSGKSTLKKLLLTLPYFTSYVPVTTRIPRKGEVNGVNYWFVSVEEYLADQTLIMKRIVDSQTMYGARSHDIDRLPADKIIVTTMDASGVQSLEKMGYTALVFHLVFPESIRSRRMIKRGDTAHNIYKRLLYDRKFHTTVGITSTIVEVTSGKPNEIMEHIINTLNALQKGVWHHDTCK